MNPVWLDQAQGGEQTEASSELNGPTVCSVNLSAVVQSSVGCLRKRHLDHECRLDPLPFDGSTTLWLRSATVTLSRSLLHFGNTPSAVLARAVLDKESQLFPEAWWFITWHYSLLRV